MFKIKDTNGETIIRFNERGDWEFSIDNTGYVDLLTQKDIDPGKVSGGKGPQFYILPEE
ncbi:MAG: hypothetical protein IJQ85_06575 [Selenomonadaceae bacterium]|nr:hypothetical protein [Selenomonadaceae bacterium]